MSKVCNCVFFASYGNVFGGCKNPLNLNRFCLHQTMDRCFNHGITRYQNKKNKAKYEVIPTNSEYQCEKCDRFEECFKVGKGMLKLCDLEKKGNVIYKLK